MEYKEKEAEEKVEVDFSKIKKDSLVRLSLVSLPQAQEKTYSKEINEKKLLGLGFTEQK